MRPQIIETSVDYVTCSGRGLAAELNIKTTGNLLAGHLERLGDRRKPARRQGYEGWRVGSLFFGERPDGWLFELSGPQAQQACRHLDWELVRASRLDIQATVQHSQYRPDVAKELSDWVAAAQMNEDAPVPPSPRFHGGHGEGDGFTIGKRGSPRYGRIYDKQQESGDPAYQRCWRWEVEYRKVAARAACERLAAASWEGGAIAGLVGRQFREWHITPPFPLDAPRLAASVGARAFDNERSLKWLQEQVRPSIDRLLGTVDVKTVLEALGLDRLHDLN